MSLRRLFLLLLVANLAGWAWVQGWMRPWGIGPVQQQEPHRLERQIQPTAVRVLSASEAAGVAMASAPGAACLASPPLDDAMVSALRRLLAAWPPGSWSFEPAVEPGRWVVYMGKYPDAGALERKKAELRARGVAFESLANPALEPGLSLGGFPTQDEAQAQLKALSDRGVRTARVVQERPDLRGTALRLPTVDEGLRGRLNDLQPLLAGQPLRPCR